MSYPGHKRFIPARNRLCGLFYFLLFIFGAGFAMAQRPLGIDVSHWQGTGVNWTSVKNSGVTYALCKATEGISTVDNTFSINIVNAKNAGVLIGAYHYARPDLHLGIAGADEEATHYWNTVSNYVKGTGTYMMPVLDIETAPGSSYTKTTLSQWVNQWCSNVVAKAAANGVTVKPIVYTYVSYSSSWLNSTVTQWTCWMAHYNGQNPQTGAPSSSSPWSTWQFWQYSSTNSVPGVSGNCDVDVFNGTAAGLGTYVVGGMSKPSFISEPSSRYADPGKNISMTASAAGAAPLKYQWRYNGANISGATNLSLTLTNIQASNAGSYTIVVTNSSGSVTSSIAKLTVNAFYTPVFADNFDVNSSSNWTLNRSSTDTRMIFAYDYSGLGIPAAPNTTNSTTKGLRMEANLSAGALAALNVSPIGQSFGGNYRLHFDMWINANGPFPAGGSGSTQVITAGVGTAGNRTQWGAAGSTADGVWFMADGEGQGSTTQGDYAAYVGTTLQADASGVYSAGTASTVRSDTNPYYANVFPGGQSAPASQKTTYTQQTGALDAGTVGFAWRDVVVAKNNNIIEWFIDGLKIASITNASITASNIFVGYWDPYTSITDNTNLSFGLIDNLRVEVPAVAPAISGQPQNLTVTQGTSATFNVSAGGNPSPNYQWRFNGANITGATASNYLRTNAQATNAGSYSVVISNSVGSVTSANAILTVNIPPTITTQPASRTINAGGTTSFSVVAGGTSSLNYQWQLNGTNLPSQTVSTINLENVQPSQAGNYSVLVSNVAGSTNSANALLSVVTMQFSSTSVSVGNNALQFSINGAPGSGYVIEASTNLVDWISLGTFVLTNGSLQVSDELTNRARFYRVSAPE